MVYQLDTFRLVRVKTVSAEGNFPGVTFSHNFRQSLKASHIRYDPQFGFRQGEDCFPLTHANITA